MQDYKQICFCNGRTNIYSLLHSEQFQAWTGFYASRNVLKGVARRASSLSNAAESLFVRYRIKYPDGPVQKEWAMDKLKAIRWAVSEVCVRVFCAVLCRSLSHYSFIFFFFFSRFSIMMALQEQNHQK